MAGARQGGNHLRRSAGVRKDIVLKGSGAELLTKSKGISSRRPRDVLMGTAFRTVGPRCLQVVLAERLTYCKETTNHGLVMTEHLDIPIEARTRRGGLLREPQPDRNMIQTNEVSVACSSCEHGSNDRVRKIDHYF
jgi:hypothetical protein